MKNDPKINALETSSAVAIQQLLPPDNPAEFAGTYTLRNMTSKLALSAGDDAPVVQSNARNTLWTLVPTGGGYYQIKNAKSGLIISVADASVQAGAKVVQLPAGRLNPGNDRWFPVKNADGTYSFFNRNSQQTLDNAGGAEGTQLTQNYAHDSSDQKFTLVASR